MIPVFRPALLGEPTRLMETLRSPWWGTGPRVGEFEAAFAGYVGAGADRCLMLNSCTAALDVALRLFPDCERVLVPGLTFISSALPALYAGKRIAFVEVGDDLCIDQRDALNWVRSERDVVVAVHFGGQAADLGALEGIRVVEDCAHALGTFEGGRHVGTHGIGCFSFQATKVLPTGDGGMLVLRPADDRGRAEALSWCGISESTWARASGEYRWRYDISEAGYKYRANDLTAALALDQWQGLGPLLERKREIAQAYSGALSALDWLALPTARPGTSPNWQEYIVRTPLRDALHRHLRERGVASTVHYFPIHKYPMFREVGEGYIAQPSLPRTEALWRELLTIPAHAGLTDEERERVIDGIRSFKP